jgi:hypothetical protein
MRKKRITALFTFSLVSLEKSGKPRTLASYFFPWNILIPLEWKERLLDWAFPYHLSGSPMYLLL